MGEQLEGRTEGQCHSRGQKGVAALEDRQKDNQTCGATLEDGQKDDQMCRAALEDNLEASDAGGTAL